MRKIWLSVVLTLLGTGGLTWAAIWIAAARDTDLGDPTAGISAADLELNAAHAPPLRFEEVAASAGITMRHGPGPRTRNLPEDTGSGLAWGDYDGDGDPDLYVVNFPGADGRGGENRLYRNDRGRFTDVADQAGVADPQGFGMGATWADYDGDGHLDLYVTNRGPNRLFRNRGDGTFDEVAERAGVADAAWSTGAAWGDFDRDGDLDLYVCNYVDYDAQQMGLGDDLVVDRATTGYHVPFTLNPNSFDPVPNRLYRNRGDGTFEEVAQAFGVDDADGRSFAATLVDLDGDGWLDLYVTNDVSTNKLYRNMLGEAGSRDPRLAGGQVVPFVDLSAMTGTADTRGSMGLSVAEVNGFRGKSDGLPDLFITHWVTQENALYQSLRLPGGGLEYRDKTREFRLGEISINMVGWGCGFADLDLDGRMDLVVANGSTLEESQDQSRLIAEPLFAFWNDGKQLVNLAPRAGAAMQGRYNARSLALADYDGDGDVDLAVGINRGRPLLLRNDTPHGNGALRVRLAGPAAACFGAKVEVTVAGTPHTQWYGADVSFLGNHAPELIFGLGRAERAQSVVVHWADGRRTTLKDAARGVVTIKPDSTGHLAERR